MYTDRENYDVYLYRPIFILIHEILRTPNDKGKTGYRSST